MWLWELDLPFGVEGKPFNPIVLHTFFTTCWGGKVVVYFLPSLIQFIINQWQLNRHLNNAEKNDELMCLLHYWFPSKSLLNDYFSHFLCSPFYSGFLFVLLITDIIHIHKKKNFNSICRFPLVTLKNFQTVYNHNNKFMVTVPFIFTQV